MNFKLVSCSVFLSSVKQGSKYTLTLFYAIQWTYSIAMLSVRNVVWSSYIKSKNWFNKEFIALILSVIKNFVAPEVHQLVMYSHIIIHLQVSDTRTCSFLDHKSNLRLFISLCYFHSVPRTIFVDFTTFLQFTSFLSCWFCLR